MAALAAVICLPGCAAGGGAPHPIEVKTMAHPFLFFSSAEIPRLRESAASTRKAQFEHLQAWGKHFAAFEPLPPAKLPDNRDVLQVYHENGAAYIFNMALLYHLTGQDLYLSAARRWFLAFCDYPADTGGNYSVGAYALAVAAGYDMLYPWLSESERTRARAHLAGIVDRGRKGTETDWWAGLLVHHDHWLPAAGLCIGAAAIAAETPGGRERLQFLMDHFRRAIDAVGQDGAWTEGAAQWVYAMAMTLPCFEACRRVTGEDLFKLPFVQGGAAYRLYNWLPDDTYVYHHDSFPNGRYNIMGSASCHVMRKLAAELRDGRAQWLADREEKVDLRQLLAGTPVHPQWATERNRLQPALHCVGWDFLWYDPSVKPVPPTDKASLSPFFVDLREGFFFPNQGLVILRSGWERKDVVFTFTCAPVGGRRAQDLVRAGDRKLTANMGHIHALAGAFNLYAHGNYLAVPPGYGMRESRNENTLTIEGCDQRLTPSYDANLPRTTAQDAQLTGLDWSDGFAYVAGEAAGCYPEEVGVARWVRHVAWLKPDVFVIGDELEGRNNRRSTAGKMPAGRKGETPSPRAGETPATHMGETPMPRTPATQPSDGPRQTIWRMDYEPEGRGANEVALDANRQAFLISPKDPNRTGALSVRMLPPPAMTLEKEIVKGPGGGWVAFGQVRASITDIFKDSPHAAILAVLTTMEKPSAAVPDARPVQAAPEEAFGAVVDQGPESRAAVFVRADSRAPREAPLTIRVPAGPKLTCLLFSLPPETAFDATSSRQPDGSGRFLHTITVRKGAGMKTSAAGTLTVTSGAAG